MQLKNMARIILIYMKNKYLEGAWFESRVDDHYCILEGLLIQLSVL